MPTPVDNRTFASVLESLSDPVAQDPARTIARGWLDAAILTSQQRELLVVAMDAGEPEFDPFEMPLGTCFK